MLARELIWLLVLFIILLKIWFAILNSIFNLINNIKSKKNK